MKVYFLHMCYVCASCFVFISCILWVLFFFSSMSARSYSFFLISPPPFSSLAGSCCRIDHVLLDHSPPGVPKCVGFSATDCCTGFIRQVCWDDDDDDDDAAWWWWVMMVRGTNGLRNFVFLQPPATHVQSHTHTHARALVHMARHTIS